MHWECRYCDRPVGYMGIPITVGDEEICACGAEWADAKILVEDDVGHNENFEMLPCGCFEEFGCNCNDDDFDDYNDDICDEEDDDCDLLYMQELKAAEEW